MAAENHLNLEDGARIAVVGGGPTGSLFSVFALRYARLIDRKLQITIFEPKEFSRHGPAGCNRCGGVISELLVQTLALEGIDLPESVVQRGINSYQLHTLVGSVAIATPYLENTIATVYRGGGPAGLVGGGVESFDKFLLDLAVDSGATRRRAVIDRIEWSDERRPRLFSGGEFLMEADLLVGSFGVNSAAGELVEQLKFGYRRPASVTTAIAEISVDAASLEERFGHSIHLFLLPIPNIKFAALIPKGRYVTLCILGVQLTTQTVKEFLAHPVVRKVLPTAADGPLGCQCLPKMNTAAPRIAFADRVVICGDAGSTRLFKDGLGAAYLMGKAAAQAAVFHGVDARAFRRVYGPVYRSLIWDNRFGRLLFWVTDLYKRHPVLTRRMVAVVQREQQRSNASSRPLSSVLWNMFTGNERYRAITRTTMSLQMHWDLWAALPKAIFRRTTHHDRW